MNFTTNSRFVLENAFVIIKVAKAAGWRGEPADLFQMGELALLEAQQAAEFDPARANFKTYVINGFLVPALLRERGAGRFGAEIDAENAPELLAANDDGVSLDEKLSVLRLSEDDERVLDLVRDTEEIADHLGVGRRRAQQKAAKTIRELATRIRQRLGIDGSPFQPNLEF